MSEIAAAPIPSADAIPLPARVAAPEVTPPVVVTGSDDRISLKRVAGPGAMAILRLWKPFVVIQLCGLAVVLCYFYVPAFTAFCGHLARLKLQGGFAFSALVMAIASGLVPEVVKYLTGVDRTLTRARFNSTLFAMGVFAVSGVFVDIFYMLQSRLYGDDNDPLTVLAKVLTDQLGLTPTFGVGWIALAYALREERFNVRTLAGKIGVRWYVLTVGRLIVPCWIYWFPMCILMYVLPPDLTFVFGATAAAASAMIFVAVASEAQRS